MKIEFSNDVLIICSIFLVVLTIATVYIIRLINTKKSLHNSFNRQAALIIDLQDQLEELRRNHDISYMSSHERINELNRVNDSSMEELKAVKIQNQEMDRMIQNGHPEIHALKLKLIEANNTIVRLKSKLPRD